MDSTDHAHGRGRRAACGSGWHHDELPPPGRVTWELAPFQDDITHTIDASSLRAGDAVNNHEHVMLFKQWEVKGEVATFIEEPGCSSPTPYAHELTSHVSIDGSSIYVDYEGKSFTAIRYDGITYETDGEVAVMQDDGNLVVYGPGGKALWASNTWGK